MNAHWLVIHPQEPLLLGHAKADTKLLSTLPYLPGRVLRGAWVDWLKTQPNPGPIADRVQDLHFGNFYPFADWQHVEYASPFLLSMLTCKARSGFVTEPSRGEERHGVVDTLLPRLVYQQMEQMGAKMALPFGLTCARCDARMANESGLFAAYDDGSGTRYVKTRLSYWSQTRVALSRHRRAATEAMLYTASSLSPEVASPDESGQVALKFLGRVVGADALVDELITAINAMPIGAMRMRGYGRITAKRRPAQMLSLRDRLIRFNQHLRETWRDLRRLATNPTSVPEEPDALYFSVDLMSPGIFRADGIPCLFPTLKLHGQTLGPVYWLTRPDFAGGWSEAWGLPKPTALAARAGSVYVFRWPEPEVTDVLIAALEDLEATGVGERCDESFGECYICHPFHQEESER